MFPFNNARKTVSDIKATFESKKDPPTSPSPSSGQQLQPQQSRNPGSLADMSANTRRPAATAKPSQPSIDAILDQATAILHPPPRPSGSKHPSWIGPKPQERAPTPHMPTMKHPVEIQFSAPGLQPPVFIATDLSDPQWAPMEMDYTTNDDGESQFFQTFTAEEGEYQYKLRLGPGDWWVCDSTQPKVDDGGGNENNLVVVSPAEETLVKAMPEILDPEFGTLDKIDSHTAPLMPHESNSHPDHKKPVQPTPEPASLSAPHIPEPLFRHETLAPAPAPADDLEDEDVEPESRPLLRHETVTPTSHEQEHSPLFQHESIANDQKYAADARRSRPSSLGGRKHSESSIPEEADPNDPTLEQFPTDHKGIMEHLDRTRRSMQEDATSHDYENATRSPGGSAVASASPSLPSLQEDEEEELERQRQEADATGLIAEEDIPQVRIYEPSDHPAAPMTPPLTPKEQDDNDVTESPLSLQEKAAEVKKLAKEKVSAAKGVGLSILAIGVAFALAAASVAAAVWFIKAKSDDIQI